ncbi:hypothetical protein [Nigerium massiliense]|uniref:hypothetical protein n=1 Tax=Nigerium massiliense TaxID=1522317 RepID=UPI00069504B5|nr:hypothetical protein [Nigerium massiliense]
MRNSRIVTWVGVLAAVSALAGVVGAFVWSRVAVLPGYRVAADGSATLGELGQMQIVSADAVYVLVGMAVGLLLGPLAWTWFKHVGWPCALIATGAGLLAALVCRSVGQLLGPGPFDARLAAAQPGDLVPVSLHLDAPSAIAVWAFAAVAPTLFLSSLGPEVRDEPARALPLSEEAASTTLDDHDGSGATRAS